MVIITISLGFFCFLSPTTHLWLVICNLAVIGVGFALFSSPNTNSVMGSVEKKFYGVASSTLGTMRLTGQSVSMAIVTLILAFYVGQIQLSEASIVQLMKGMKTTFIVFTLLCFIGIFASWIRGKKKQDATH